MLALCPESIALGSRRMGDPKSLAQRELHLRTTSVGGAVYRAFFCGDLSQDCRPSVTKLRRDDVFADAAHRRAGDWTEHYHYPHMSENNEEGSPLEPGGEELLTRKEIARRLRRCVGTVDNWRKFEGLPSIEKGNTVYFVWPEVKGWLKSGSKKAGRRKTADRHGEAEERMAAT